MALAATASGADVPLREHVVRTVRRAGPVMLARAGLLVMVSVDTIMCGRVGAQELAYYGIAFAPHMAFLLFGIGQPALHQFKRPDGIIDEHEEHIPVCPIGNAFTAFRLYAGMYRRYGINGAHGGLLLRKDNFPCIGDR